MPHYVEIGVVNFLPPLQTAVMHRDRGEVARGLSRHTATLITGIFEKTREKPCFAVKESILGKLGAVFRI